MAQDDAIAVDPAHYTVVGENEQVRVLRIRYGPGEKSAMHSHPASVAIFLTDAAGRFNYPDGTADEIHGKAGDVLLLPATTHLPENLGNAAFEVILVEVKG
jgi:quercetin dioxygenase-like cupin family protein